MEKLISKYYRTRSKYWRLKRILFPSPAELKLIEIMGGKIYRIEWLKNKRTGFCFAIVLSLGKYFRDEKFGREVRCGRYYIDFGNDIFWGIEVDGSKWHMDVVAEFDREIYLKERGWRLLRIDAIRLWNEPAKVQSELLRFFYK